MLLLALAFALLMGGAGASEGVEPEGGPRHGDWDDNDQGHDRARRASAGGQILTMTELLGRIHTQVTGRILDAELEHEDGAWIYEIKVLDPEGRLYELVVDAKSGRVLQRWGSD
jgi:uncharacterized membrane protein YkoI